MAHGLGFTLEMRVKLGQSKTFYDSTIFFAINFYKIIILGHTITLCIKAFFSFLLYIQKSSRNCNLEENT